MKFWSQMKSFAERQDGTVTVSFGLATLALFVASGMAIDYGHWTTQKVQLQAIADSAALSAAQKITTPGWTETGIQKELTAYITRNGTGLDRASLASVTVDTVAKTISVKVAAPGQRSLTGLFLTKDPILNATAKVAYTANRGVSTCMIALDPTAAPALTASGGTRISSPGCGTQVNSTSTLFA